MFIDPVISVWYEHENSTTPPRLLVAKESAAKLKLALYSPAAFDEGGDGTLTGSTTTRRTSSRSARILRR
jgi:hypothetical protein